MFKRLYDKFVSWVRKLNEYPSVEEGSKIITRRPFTGCAVFSEFKIWYLNSKLHREDGPAIEWFNGLKEWYLNDKRHRVDGPAIEFADGEKHWYLNGIRHREDGPAVELANGSKFWYLNGKRHRQDGPAIEFHDGAKEWYLNGELHREDGPAIESANGYKAWWLDGEVLFWLPPESQPFILLEEFVDEEGKEQIKILNQKGTEIWPNLPGLKELADNWEKK